MRRTAFSIAPLPEVRNICHKSVLIISGLLLMDITLLAGYQNPAPTEAKINTLAPELGLEKLLQAPKKAKTDRRSLEGKVVVLDFWATWCAPCIAAMPHLNDLIDKFKDRPIQFISITDEEESAVTGFLKRRVIKGWVGLDNDRSVFEAYGVLGLPHTVVIGRDGKIATITKPKSLTETMLNETLDVKPVPSAQGRSNAPNPPSQKPLTPDDMLARFTLTIKPTKSENPSWSRTPGRFQARAIDLKTVLSLLYMVTKTRIIGSTLLEDARYDISASMLDGNKNELESILVKAIEASFRLKVRREIREMEVFVLTAPEQTTVNLKPNPSEVSRSSVDAGVIAASAVPMGVLAEKIEGVFKQPVIDETKLQGNYDWNLVFDERKPSSIIDEVRKELGLQLKRTTRQIEVFVVEIE